MFRLSQFQVFVWILHWYVSLMLHFHRALLHSHYLVSPIQILLLLMRRLPLLFHFSIYVNNLLNTMPSLLSWMKNKCSVRNSSLSLRLYWRTWNLSVPPPFQTAKICGLLIMICWKVEVLIWKELSTMRTWVTKPEANLYASCAPPSDLSDAVCDRDRYKVLLQSIAAQVQALQAGYANTVRRSQGSQASLRDSLCSLLVAFELFSLG